MKIINFALCILGLEDIAAESAPSPHDFDNFNEYKDLEGFCTEGVLSVVET